MKKLCIFFLAVILLLSGCTASEAAAETTSAAVTFPTAPERILPVSPSQAGLEDGTYSIDVILTGGSGRAGVLSPAKLEIENDRAVVTLVWSSSNYDYMVVEGQRYDPVTMEGGSTFCFPLPGVNGHVDVIGDTIAMSTPHEIAYTLFLDAASAVKENP